MRKKLKSFVAALTTVVMVLSMTAFVSAASDTKSGIVENVDYGYSYSWEYYVADDVLKIYASTTNLVINWYDLSSDVYDYFTSNTLVEIDVSDLFRGEFWWHRGYMEIYGHNCPSGKLSIIGDSLESFDRFLFCGFMTLEEVTFDECTTLSYIELNNCGITSVDIFEGVDTPELHFVSCNDLVDAVIPQGIRYAILESCENVTSIQTPMYFQLLDVQDLPNLTDLDITDSIDWCYLTDVGLTDVTVPGDCQDFRINSESLETATIESGFNYIRRDMFKLCTNLSSVSIPDGVTLISYSAFGFCYNLSHIELPSSVNTISAGAFIGSGIESINIPDGVTRIEYATFRGCDYLSTVSIPSSVTTIEETAFDSCDALSDVYFDGSKTEWEAITIHCRETDSVSEMSIYDVFGDAEIHFSKSSLSILDQPSDMNCNVGEIAIFLVAAEGDGLKYQWQVLKPGATEWVNCSINDGAKTSRLDIEVKESRNGCQYKCVVTDKYGATVETEPFTLTVGTPLEILEQPECFEGYEGEYATFTVVANGEGFKYQWQVDKNGWTNCSVNDGAKTDTLTLEIKPSRDGYCYRCVITDKYGSMIISEEAMLGMDTSLRIAKEPTDFSGAIGENAEFTVEAKGVGLKYQWQVLKNGTWTNCSKNDGAKTNTLSQEIKESRDGSVYRCVITDKYGDTKTTDEVTLSISHEIYIASEPQYFFGKIGENAEFTVEAEGVGLKYQWQVWKNGAWTNCSINDGARTDTLTLLIKESRDGSKYQCIITDKYGTVATTREVYLYVDQDVPVPEGFEATAAESAVAVVENPIEETVEVIEVVEAIDVPVVETVSEAEAS